MPTSLPIHPVPKITGPSLNVATTKRGYVVHEAAPLLGARNSSERAWRAIGGALIGGAYLQWFIPLLLDKTGSGAVHLALGVALLAAGMVLFALAARRYRKSLVVDLSNRQLKIALTGARDVKVTRQEIAMDHIESIFVKPGDCPNGKASLHLRLKGGAGCVAMLSGARTELEVLHSSLCNDVRLARNCRPRRVRRRPAKYGAFQPKRPSKEAAMAQMKAAMIAAE